MNKKNNDDVDDNDDVGDYDNFNKNYVNDHYSNDGDYHQ